MRDFWRSRPARIVAIAFSAAFLVAYGRTTKATLGAALTAEPVEFLTVASVIAGAIISLVSIGALASLLVRPTLKQD